MKLQIGIFADYFMQWMGGAGILLLISEALKDAEAISDSEVTLLFSAPAELQSMTRNVVFADVGSIRASGVYEHFFAQTTFEKACFVRDARRAVSELGIDVIGPTGVSLGSDFQVPWVSYIPDFQHRHFPGFFSENERTQRDTHFRRLLYNSVMTVVNSSVVMEDIKTFYAKAERPGSLHLLPMLLPKISVSISQSDIRTKYSLADEYLICCSQQWMHKRHEVAIKAFRRMLDSGGSSEKILVFTGVQSDYRAPNYGSEIERLIDKLQLRNHVRYLGYCPRDEQLALIQNAVAIVQASVLEGGAGASGTLEAALLGTPVIASDIAPNRELGIGRCDFFTVDDEVSLANRMAAAFGARRSRAIACPQIAAMNLAGGIRLTELLRQAAG